MYDISMYRIVYCRNAMKKKKARRNLIIYLALSRQKKSHTPKERFFSVYNLFAHRRLNPSGCRMFHFEYGFYAHNGRTRVNFWCAVACMNTFRNCAATCSKLCMVALLECLENFSGKQMMIATTSMNDTVQHANCKRENKISSNA